MAGISDIFDKLLDMVSGGIGSYITEARKGSKPGKPWKDCRRNPWSDSSRRLAENGGAAPGL